MPKTKTFDPDEFLFDLFAMRVSEVQEMFWGEIESKTPHIEKIEVMLESGLVDVNAKDNRGWSPLHWASEYNFIEIAKLLLERGADPWAEDSANKIPKIPYDYAKEKLKLKPLLREYMKKPFAKKKNIV